MMQGSGRALSNGNDAPPVSDLQLVTFQLSAERYGIDIMDVREIVRLQDIRSLPNVPSFIAGILNLRGRIVPIIDLHERFRLKRTATSDEDKLLAGIVIIHLDGVRVGMVIDRVSRVATVDREQIQPPPQVLAGIGSEYIHGVVNQGDGYLVLLDIHHMFSAQDLRQINQLRS